MARFHDITRIPVIDAHVHVFPAKLAASIKKWFDEYAWSFHHQGTPRELVGELFDYGAAGAVIMPYAHRPGISRGLNDHTADIMKRFNRVAGLAAIHPADEDPEGILKHAFGNLGLRGVKLHCHVLGIAPDDPVLEPVYRTAIEHDAVVVIHAGREPAVDAYGLDVYTVSGAGRVENLLRKHPEMKLVIPHLGFNETDRFYELLDRFPNLYLDTAMLLADFFDYNIERPGLVRYADRILYGSDYPHIPYPLDTELRAVIGMDLGEEATRKILYQNARKLFGINGGA